MGYCKSCDGTGLYIGFAEKEGCAVVCYHCKGTGGNGITRKEKYGVIRVFAHSAGYGHAPTGRHKHNKTGKYFNFEDGGCTYEEWKQGVQPRPLKGLYCPYLWTQQELQNKDKNGLYKNYCSKILGFNSIIDCKRYPKMDECWDIYDNKDVYLEALKLKGIIANYDLDGEQKITYVALHHSLKNNTIPLEWFNNEDNFLEFMLYLRNNLGSVGAMENFRNIICVHHPKMYNKYRLMLE
jgi:hypothetical protein